MSEHFVITRQAYVFVYDPDSHVGHFRSKRVHSSDIMIERRLSSIWESKPNGTLALFSLDCLPLIYHPKSHTVSKVRDMKSDYCQIAGDLLMTEENGKTKYWLNKGNDYHHLRIGNFGFDTHSYVIIKDTNGANEIQVGSRRIKVMPEEMSCLYQEQIVNKTLASNPKPSDITLECKLRRDFPLELLIDRSLKYNVSLAVSPGKRYAIRYSRRSSDMRLWYGNVSSMTYLKISKGHACGISSVCFLGKDEYVASLDTIGTLKIWHLDNEVVDVCQTISFDQFDRPEDYLHVQYEPLTHMLKLEYKDGFDFFTLRLNTYKRKTKNNLIQFQYTEFKPKKLVESPEVQAKEAEPISARLEPKPIFASKPKFSLSGGYDLCKVSRDRHDKTESQSQKTNTRFKKGSIEISVGIDFGTSRTKICYRTAVDDIGKILHFDRLRERYLDSEYENWTIPSIVAKSRGKFLFGYDALLSKAKSKYPDLKSSLLSANIPEDNVVACASFLAYLFDESEKQIKEEAGIVQNYRFSYSVCLPVEHLNNNKIVEKSHVVLKLAELINDKKCYANPNAVQDQLDHLMSSEKAIIRDYSQLIAESAAEIADFHSRTRKPGLYALFDFGAGTTDMTVFNITNDVSKKADMLGAKVVNKGFSHIEEAIRNHDSPDSIVRKHYLSIYEEFRQSGILKEVKDKLLGDGTWKKLYEMQILASGGGALHKEVINVFSQPMQYDYDGSKGPKKIQLLKDPPRWLANEAPYFRCAVAYGLSGDPNELKENYVLPKDCKAKTYKDRIKELTEEEILENQRRFLNG